MAPSPAYRITAYRADGSILIRAATDDQGAAFDFFGHCQRDERCARIEGEHATAPYNWVRSFIPA